MRTIIDKYQRLAYIMEQYAEQIKELAEKQLIIQQKVIKEFKLNDHYDYRDIMTYDYLKIGEDASVELWESGRCGDSDSCMTSINIHDLIIKGDLEGYEKFYRASHQARAEQAALAKQKEAEKRKQSLVAEMARIQSQLEQLNGNRVE